MKTSNDIFEQYGTFAKQYDCLCAIASRRQLTCGEMGFIRAFGDMLSGDAEQSEMMSAHRIWMDEERHKTT